MLIIGLLFWGKPPNQPGVMDLGLTIETSQWGQHKWWLIVGAFIPTTTYFWFVSCSESRKKINKIVSSKSGIVLLPKNIQNVEHICWEAIHRESAVQTHGQLPSPSWSVTVSFAWSSHVSTDFDINSFLEDGTGLTQFLYLFHKIQISIWKPTPWRYPYVVLARISWGNWVSQFLWKLRVATGLWGRLLSDLTFAKFPLVLPHAQNLIRYIIIYHLITFIIPYGMLSSSRL